MIVRFSALVKKVSSKALVSLDKEYEIILRGESPEMGRLVDAPADQVVDVIIKTLDEKDNN